MRVAIYILMLSVICCGELSAQNLPHRKQVRQGNEAFGEERYERSIDIYKEALKHDSTLFEAIYNVGNSHIKTKQWEEAKQRLSVAASDTTRSAKERAAAYYNLGYAQFMQDSIQRDSLKLSLESFRRSLVLNPEDMDAKYNYVYVRTLLEQQQNQGGGDGDGGGEGDDQNDQNSQNQNNPNNPNNQQNPNNNNQNNGQNNNQNDDKNDPNKDNQNDNQNDRKDNRDNPDRNDNQNDNQSDKPKDNKSDGGDDNNDNPDNQPRGGDNPEQEESPSGMTPEQREQMLDAIQAQEDKTQQKVDDADKKRGILIRGKKNW